MGKAEPKDVFISYATSDQHVADKLCEILEKFGISCWIATRDASKAGDFDVAIVEAISQCKAVAVILSAESNDSRYVKGEVNRAFDRAKPILTFRIEDIKPTSALELYLACGEWTDGFPPPIEERIVPMVKSLFALLGHQPPSPPLKSELRPPKGDEGPRIDGGVTKGSNGLLGFIVLAVVIFAIFFIAVPASKTPRDSGQSTITLPGDSGQTAGVLSRVSDESTGKSRRDSGQLSSTIPLDNGQSTKVRFVIPEKGGAFVGETLNVTLESVEVPPGSELWVVERRGGEFWPKEPSIATTPMDGKWHGQLYMGGLPGKLDLVLFQVPPAGQERIRTWFAESKQTGKYPPLHQVDFPDQWLVTSVTGLTQEKLP